MVESTARRRLAQLLAFCLWTSRTTAYVPVEWRTDKYFGVDGPWQAVNVWVGGWVDNIVDSAQQTQVSLYPGGSYSSAILSSDLCTAHSSSICGSGGTWNPKGGQTGSGYPISWEPAVDYTSSSGLYMLGPIYMQNLDIGAGGNSQTSPNASMSAVNIGNITLPNGRQVDLEVGSLSLGAEDQQQVFTTGSTTEGDDTINAWIFPGYLYNQSLSKSYSYSLHIGSTAFNYPGSLIYGGYDKGRAIGPGTTYGDDPPQLQDIVLGVETGGSPWDFDSKKGLLLTNTSANDPIPAYPDSLVPYLHLPKNTCDNLAKQLPVTFDSSGYYLWNTNDPSYYNITTSAAYLGFVFPPATGDTAEVTIKVPFQLLVLNLTTEASGKSGSTPYFPCMPYDPDDGSHLLGRAFLQAAFWGRNWNQHVSWLAQAPGPGSSKNGLGNQYVDIEDSDTTLDFYAGDDYFRDSWSDYWSPLPGGTDDSVDNGSDNNNDGGDDNGGLSTGAQAGIGVGAGIVGLALIGAGLFFLLRRRKQSSRSKAETASANESFLGGNGGNGAAAHYGNDAKSNPQYWQQQQQQQAFSPHQQQQQRGWYQPHGMGDQPYQSYEQYGKTGGQGQPAEAYEMSGTMRSPATELPGHEPNELEAPGPKFVRQPQS